MYLIDITYVCKRKVVLQTGGLGVGKVALDQTLKDSQLPPKQTNKKLYVDL